GRVEPKMGEDRSRAFGGDARLLGQLREDRRSERPGPASLAPIRITDTGSADAFRRRASGTAGPSNVAYANARRGLPARTSLKSPPATGVSPSSTSQTGDRGRRRQRGALPSDLYLKL